MRIGIVQFPGSNCERETMQAVKRAFMEPIEFLWNEPREKLRTMDGYIIVGGFSYEDRSRAGVIAALDPVLQELKAQSEKGKPLLGICNGAQILVEAGLVPGLENNKLAMSLTENKRVVDGKVIGTGYYNTWVHVRLPRHYQRNAFTQHCTGNDVIRLPIAHGEGRFVMTEALANEIEMQGLNVFQYCNEQGEVLEHFPVNPNGSFRNIAAISNKAGNVMAMMPHPERTDEGRVIFSSMRHYIESGRAVASEHIPLYYYPRHPTQQAVYQKPAEHFECTVSLLITDNQALTVQNTLQQMQIPVTVQRQIHWEVACDSAAIFTQIKQSGVLYNARKETESKQATANKTHSFLVRAKEDSIGQHTQHMLANHFGINGVNAIARGVLWHFTCEDADVTKYIPTILSTNIIANPYAHDCYQYATSLS